MGWSIGFGFGPIRYRAIDCSERERRRRGIQPLHHRHWRSGLATASPGMASPWRTASPVGLQVELQQLAAKLNAMPAQRRAISRHDVQTAQTLREGSYVFNADNYAVAIGNR